MRRLSGDVGLQVVVAVIVGWDAAAAVADAMDDRVSVNVETISAAIRRKSFRLRVAVGLLLLFHLCADRERWRSVDPVSLAGRAVSVGVRRVAAS